MPHPQPQGPLPSTPQAEDGLSKKMGRAGWKMPSLREPALPMSWEAALWELAAGACLAPASRIGLGVSRMRPHWQLCQGLEHFGPCGARQEPRRRLRRR